MSELRLWGDLMRRLGVLVMVLLCCTGMAYGKNKGTSADVVRIAGAGNVEFKAFITGAGRALEAANATLDVKGEKQLYCQPNIAITEDQYLRILETHIEKYPKDGEIPAAMFGVTMLSALQQAFPCK
ncbi:hypothetical protein HJA76_09815 [Rhizobium bangladeshense]|uniref:hypothetical protein n=1 Tax=Rhizobium bangladeshense TaxID=1138189 RepID=UPI001C8281AA|nr:hypothetical protein [Rhizobium bangladeshense]MBX4920004.1 hypothetical protein [Rhizobium bangladeshense]